MKLIAKSAIGIAAAFLIVACIALEDRIAKVSSPEMASTAITTGCTGGRDFIEAATASIDPTAAALIVKGVEAACALRAKRTPVSATIYDDPLDAFCAETKPLASSDATDQTRTAFYASRTDVCEARS
jgi:hypothetical protein